MNTFYMYWSSVQKFHTHRRNRTLPMDSQESLPSFFSPRVHSDCFRLLTKQHQKLGVTNEESVGNRLRTPELSRHATFHDLFRLNYILVLIGDILKLSWLVGYVNKKFWEELIAYVLLKRHGPRRKRSIQQFFYCCVCIHCSGNVFTEQLPSNERRDRLHRAFA
jgi:hypothetical protein